MGAVAGLLLINLSLVAFLALRKPMPPPGGSPDREGPKKLIIDKLDFTAEQTAQYEQLIKQHQTEIRQLNDEISRTKNRLYRTLAGDNQSPKDSLINRLGALQRQVETTHYNHFLALKKLCTPSQQGNFNDLTRELSTYFAQPAQPPRNQ